MSRVPASASTVVKNKVAPPFRKAEFDIMFGEGISRTGDVLDLAVDRNIVDKAGSWYSFHDTRLGQGRERAREFLKENDGHHERDRGRGPHGERPGRR